VVARRCSASRAWSPLLKHGVDRSAACLPNDWTSAADQSADQSVPRVTSDPSRALIAEMPARFERHHATLAILHSAEKANLQGGGNGRFAT